MWNEFLVACGDKKQGAGGGGDDDELEVVQTQQVRAYVRGLWCLCVWCRCLCVSLISCGPLAPSSSHPTRACTRTNHHQTTPK